MPDKKYSASIQVTCETGPPPPPDLPVAHETFDRLWTAILKLHSTIPISKVLFERDDPGDRLLWNYKCTSIDGREWSQTIRFAYDSPMGGQDSDPMHTFSVPEAWRRTEFLHHVDVRGLLIQVRNQWPFIIKVSVKYDVELT